ncbi:DUF4142 domain-containing protein [Actinoplanes sp. GCM10030250]|uniref:DUF4142 domain-containing protein n=1 Tax=Actinoplanes sp. GCM10030250 TaxID=3273376 RepID=UPI003610904E
MFFRSIFATLGMASSLAGLPATAAQADPSAQDAAFIRAAHQVNLAEIASGQIAWRKTTDPEVKNLAATFMRDHIHLDADLYKTARTLRIVLPSAPTAEQQALTKRYEAAGADTFDEYYISNELSARREALALTSTQTQKGADPAVKDLAEKAAPMIARHQQMLQKAANS